MTAIQDVNTDMDLVYEALEQLREIMVFENNGTTSRLVDFFRFCRVTKTSASSSVTYSASTPSTEPSVTLSSSGKSVVSLSVSSGSLIGLSPEAVSTSSTIVMTVDSSTETSISSELKLKHSPSTTIPSPTESYISDEATSSIEVNSLTLNVDDVLVTSSVGVSQEQDRFPWLNVRNLDECDVAEHQFKKYINDIILAPYGHIKRHQEFFNLADIYRRGPEPYSECFVLIEEGKRNLNYFWTVLDLINNVTHGNLIAMKNLTSLLEIFHFQKIVDGFDARLQQVCGWQVKMLQSSEFYLGHIRDYRPVISDAMNTIRAWRDILRYMWRNKPFATENIEQYLTKDITKQELAKQFLSEQNVTKREIYFNRIQNIDVLMQRYSGHMDTIRVYILFSAYPGLTYIFDNNYIQQLQLVQKAMTVRSMADLARRGDLSGITWEIENAIDENIKQLNQGITEILADMRLKLKTIETNLREYNDSIKMDSQFYL